MTPTVYQFEHAVADGYIGINIGANEAHDGYATNGQYCVLLPDDWTQIETYNNDDVKYAGASSPYKPAQVNDKPTPAPYHAQVMMFIC